MKSVIETLEENGFTEMVIGVANDNLNAKHIYEKLGFTNFIRRDHSDEEDPVDYNVYLRKN